MPRQFGTEIILPANPSNVLGAVTKQYCDLKQPLDPELTTLASLASTTDNMIQGVAGAWASRTPAQVKAALAITESDVTNLVADLGNKQPLDADLTTIAGLTPTTDNVIQSVAGAWASRTPAQVKTALAITESDVANLVTDLGNKQPLDTDLTTIAGLTATTDNFIQAKSSAWASRTLAQVAADLATILQSKSAKIAPIISNITYAASVTPDSSLGNLFRCTLTGDVTMAVPTNPVDGDSIQFEFTASGAQRVITLNASILMTTGISSPITVPSGKIWFGAMRYKTSSWYLLASQINT